MIGYKLMREDLTSASHDSGVVQYGTEWIEVPGHGAYVAHTLTGLLRGGYESVLAEVEYEDPTGGGADGNVTTARRARVLRHAVVDPWSWARVAIRCARAVAHLSVDPLAMAVIVAAERGERERTRESIEAAARAVKALVAMAVPTVEAWVAGAAMWAAVAVVAVRDAEVRRALLAAWARAAASAEYSASAALADAVIVVGAVSRLAEVMVPAAMWGAAGAAAGSTGAAGAAGDKLDEIKIDALRWLVEDVFGTAGVTA